MSSMVAETQMIQNAGEAQMRVTDNAFAQVIRYSKDINCMSLKSS